MLNKNKLLLAILTLLLVLSVGYALFSEKININGTIQATGDFEITAMCSAGYSQELINAGVVSSQDYNQTGFENDSCSANGTEVSLATGLKYPGARRYFTVKMTNTGVVGAKFDDAHIADKSMPYVEFDGTVNGIYLMGGITETEEPVGVTGSWSISYIADDGTRKSSRMATVNDVIVFINGNACSYKDSCFDDFSYIDVDESIYYIIEFVWPEDFAKLYEDGEGRDYERYEVDYSISVYFEQITLSEQK